jgi:membrane protein required for colicin V production
MDIRNFNLFDWFLVAVVTYSTVAAYVRGLFREVFLIVGLVAGILIASWNYALLSTRLLAILPWATAQIVAFLLIAILVMVLCGVIGRLLNKTAKKIGLGFVDRALGAVFGFARGCLLGVAIMMAAAAFASHKEYIRNSELSSYFLQGAHAISFVVPTNLQQHIRAGVRQLTHGT